MLPWKNFCQGALGQKFQFLKNGLFLLQNVFISDFLARIRNQRLRIDPLPNFSSIGQKIRELKFWPGTIPKTAWWRHTQLLVMTSAKFLWLLRDFVPEYHHAKFSCNGTTNKRNREGGGHNVPHKPIWFQKTPAWTGLMIDDQWLVVNNQRLITIIND